VQLILEILIRVAEILAIIAGSAGILVSMMLLFSPGMIRKANRILNKQILSENQMAAYNLAICSEPFTLRYHIACGGLLVAGSIFILMFLFLGVPVPAGFGLFMDMAISFSVLLGKTAGIVGFAAGALLFFSPGAFKAVGEKVNMWVDTEPAFSKLDTLSVDVDSIFIKYPLVCGLLGLVVSTALLVVSIANFLGTFANLRGIL